MTNSIRMLNFTKIYQQEVIVIPTVKGTKDIIFPETEKWEYIRSIVREIYTNYGYREIVTPIIEYTELYQRSIGNYTDIVQKEMFIFTDRKGRSISLRPEGTAGVIRAYIDNNLAYLPGIKKFFYIGPMFRAERPQKGRYRQFHQFGSEAIGSDSPLLDAEVIKMNIELLRKLEIKNFFIKINSVGCRKCQPEYINILQKFLLEKKQFLCDDCKTRSEKNPLRVFDCKNPTCQRQYNEAPVLIDNLCNECAGHFKKLKEYLKIMDIEYTVEPKLVRGFDYYTRTVFEIVSESLGAQNAVLGGGRYNYLVEQLGGSPAPAVGAAAGIERLLLAIEEQNTELEIKGKVSVYVVKAGDISDNILFKTVDLLRENNIITFLSYTDRSLKSQLNEANKFNVDYAVIIGEDEIRNKSFTLRDMKRSIQLNIDIDDINNPLEIVKKITGGE